MDTKQNPHRLILMLFDGALAAIAAAKARFSQQTGVTAVMPSKAISIIEEGAAGYRWTNCRRQIGGATDPLYEYMSHRFKMHNINNDVAAIDEVTALLNMLRDAWQQIGGPSRQTAPAPQPDRLHSLR